MMQQNVFLFTFCTLISQHVFPAQEIFPSETYDKRLRPSEGGSPDEVTVTTTIREVLCVEESTQTSEVDVYVTLKWKDRRLKWDVQKEGRIQKRLEPDSIWVPGIDFDNSLDTAIIGKQSVFVQGDSGLVEFKRRFQVKLSNNMDFRFYPFDAHQLVIDIRCFFYNSQEVVMVADKLESSMKEGLDHSAYSLSNFGIDEYVTRAVEPEDRYAGVKTTIKLKRKPSLAVIGYVIPLIVTVLMSMMQLWMHVDRFDVRAGLASTALLAIMFNTYVVLEGLPDLSYLTWMHWFLVLSMVYSYANLAQAILVHWRELNPKLRAGVPAIEEFCQMWFPVSYVVICFLLLFWGVSSQKE